MASSNSRLRKCFLGGPELGATPHVPERSRGKGSLLLGVLGALSLHSGVALAADPAPTTPATTTPSSFYIDSRRALPMFPANSWKDGFFVEHSGIGDFGLHVRGTGVYGRNPLGTASDLDSITNRFTLHAAALLAIAGWVELGVAMPFVLYQDPDPNTGGGGLNLTKTAIGDLRLLGKINFHLPDKAPQIALSMGLGFQTATDNSSFGAGTISGYPRLIIDMPKLFGKRLHIAANLGAVIAGTKRPCTQDELNQINAANMTMPMAGTTGTTTTTTAAPDCQQRQLGLGNHIMWGIGASGQISSDQGLYVTTELIGSFSVGTEQETKTPLFWTIGLRRSKANATYFSAAYGIGLNDASPSHTVLVGLGLIWEAVPDKKKEIPTVKVDINVTGLLPGATVTTGNKDGSKTQTVPAPPPKLDANGKPLPPDATKPPGAGGAPGAAGPPAAKPPKPEPIQMSSEVEVPAGLVPAEASKGGGKGKD